MIGYKKIYRSFGSFVSIEIPNKLETSHLDAFLGSKGSNVEGVLPKRADPAAFLPPGVTLLSATLFSAIILILSAYYHHGTIYLLKTFSY